MIARVLLATIFVGFFAGLVSTAVQQWRVVPLIIAAEAYEGVEPSGEAGHQHGALKRPSSNLPAIAEAFSPVQPAVAHEHGGDAGLLGLGRLGGTLLANLVTGAAFALLLLAVSVLSGRSITLSNAAVWGACGWLAVHFLPALGLPPELPGFPVGALQARQIWWVATVLASSIGLWLLIAETRSALKIAGAGLIVVPHIYGAPQPEDIVSSVPALFAAEYAVAALAASLILWMALAFMLGFALQKIGFNSAQTSES
jgi:cobalt transporter subunit CbtA